MEESFIIKEIANAFNKNLMILYDYGNSIMNKSAVNKNIKLLLQYFKTVNLIIEFPKECLIELSEINFEIFIKNATSIKYLCSNSKINKSDDLEYLNIEYYNVENYSFYKSENFIIYMNKDINLNYNIYHLICYDSNNNFISIESFLNKEDCEYSLSELEYIKNETPLISLYKDNLFNYKFITEQKSLIV